MVCVYVFVFVANSELCETEGPSVLFEFLLVMFFNCLNHSVDVVVSLCGICDVAAANRKTELIIQPEACLISRLNATFCKFSRHRACRPCHLAGILVGRDT